MDKNKVITFLKDNGLNDIEEISNKRGITMLTFCYDFEDAELDAAKAYADDEFDGDEEAWYDEFFLPYLSELAVDNVGDVVQDLMEAEDLKAQYASYEIDRENYDYNEFVAIFYNKNEDIDMDEVLNELEQ